MATEDGTTVFLRDAWISACSFFPAFWRFDPLYGIVYKPLILDTLMDVTANSARGDLNFERWLARAEHILLPTEAY